MAKRFCSFCGMGLEPFAHKQYCDDECAQKARRATDALRQAHDRESPPPGFQPFFGGRWESSGEVRALDRVSKYPPIDTIKNFVKIQKNSVYGVQATKPGTYYGALHLKPPIRRGCGGGSLRSPKPDLTQRWADR